MNCLICCEDKVGTTNLVCLDCEQRIKIGIKAMQIVYNKKTQNPVSQGYKVVKKGLLKR